MHHNKEAVFHFTFLFNFITFITSLLKIIYGAGRPFWMWVNINSYECATDYGNPSGHASVAFTFYLMIIKITLYDSELF